MLLREIWVLTALFKQNEGVFIKEKKEREMGLHNC
jgi:hypothetical protein